MREERLMERKIGTVSRGVRCPIIREGDNLPEIVVIVCWRLLQARALPCMTVMLLLLQNP